MPRLFDGADKAISLSCVGTLMSDDHLVLAGGGHTHALILRRWSMKPSSRPKGLITLINRASFTLYSGMLPGLISGSYNISEVLIDLRVLAEQAGVVFIVAEITGLNLKENLIRLRGRPSICYTRISIDVGSETYIGKENQSEKKKFFEVPIRPLEKAIQFIEKQDHELLDSTKEPFTVVGSGLTAIEVALALRIRWHMRPIRLQAEPEKLRSKFKQALLDSNIKLIDRNQIISGPKLLCTGSHSPGWLRNSRLPVDTSGRVLTTSTLQVISHPSLFAVGDCGVIKDNYRPPSGVWAVRASKVLAKNLERCGKNLKPCAWYPQRRSLYLIGGERLKSRQKVAWLFWSGLLIGPHPWLWKCKQAIDRKFLKGFDLATSMTKGNQISENEMGCRGCAAKLPAEPLKGALKSADYETLGSQPEDAYLIAFSQGAESFYQSVDGFPALVSDPWLNGRMSTLHACSDIWAMGASVTSAQVVITLPKVPEKIQQEFLAQSLLGVKSALEPQGAKLIGGHTIEARSDSPQPSSFGIQMALSINGCLSSGVRPWTKGGMQLGDELLISRGIGSGVLFAASRVGQGCPKDLDSAMKILATSQHDAIRSLLKVEAENFPIPAVHACTDITGFGLLGHLEEMLVACNSLRDKSKKPLLKLKLQADLIPSFDGALDLLESGFFSTLAPHNRRAWRSLVKAKKHHSFIDLVFGEDNNYGSKQQKRILELIVDPQTCGPLLLSCSSKIASTLIANGPWKKIGCVDLLSRN